MGQPLGFVSAAEGLVFLSACMAGLVQAARGRHRQGPGLLVAGRASLRVFCVHLAIVLASW